MRNTLALLVGFTAILSLPSQAQTTPGSDPSSSTGRPNVYFQQGQGQTPQQFPLPNQTPKKSNSGKSPVDPSSLMNALKGLGSAGSGSSGRGGGNFNDGSSGGGFSGASVNNCPGAKPDPTALQTMLECTKKLSQATNRYAGLVDVDRKVMFVIDRNSGGAVVECIPVSTGKSVGDQKGQTPRGCMYTDAHSGPTYQSSGQEGTQRDCIGLVGTDSETRNRVSNGVVIHRAHGGAGQPATAGCIGIQDDKFDNLKEMLYGSDQSRKHSAVCTFTSDSREHCSIGEGSGSTGRGYPTGTTPSTRR